MNLGHKASLPCVHSKITASKVMVLKMRSLDQHHPETCWKCRFHPPAVLQGLAHFLSRVAPCSCHLSPFSHPPSHSQFTLRAKDTHISGFAYRSSLAFLILPICHSLLQQLFRDCPILRMRVNKADGLCPPGAYRLGGKPVKVRQPHLKSKSQPLYPKVAPDHPSP